MLLRYIVFYCESGCDTSEPHVSYISRACSSLVRQSYYIPNRFSLKIRGLVVVLTVRKVHWAGRASNQPSGLLLSARVPTSRNVYRGDFRFCRIVLYDAAFFMSKKLGRPCRAPNPEVGCEPGGVIHVLFENPSVSRFFLCILQSSAGKHIAFMLPSRKSLQKFPHHRMLIQP